MDLTIKKWGIEEETGYKPSFTFYGDLSIAERFGKAAIVDTFQRIFSEWKGNCKALTELCMVLNWKIYEFYGRNDAIAKLYGSMFRKVDEYAVSTLKGEELNYFYDTTD